jgi:hypothetical protein
VSDDELPDWGKVIRELRAAGFDCEQVAALCRASGVEVTGSALRYLAARPGAEPRFSVGLLLRRLHLEHVMGAFDVDVDS